MIMFIWIKPQGDGSREDYEASQEALKRMLLWSSIGSAVILAIIGMIAYYY
jgi:hypothetical protein